MCLVMSEFKKENERLRKEVDEMSLKDVNNENKGIEVTEQEENTWVKIARKLKNEHIIERLEKVVGSGSK